MNESFAKDFITLQSSIMTMPKDKSGYGYKYTDLDTIISNLKPLLQKNNFGFIQLLKTLTVEGGKTITGIETLVLHSSGESVSSFVAIPDIQVGKANNAQNIGAAITYFKRYALAAAFGISSDEDVDCSTQIMEQNQRNLQKPAPVKEEPKKYTKQDTEEVKKLLEAEYSDGGPIFNEDDRAMYRKVMIEEGGKSCIQLIKATIEDRKKNTQVPDGIFPA